MSNPEVELQPNEHNENIQIPQSEQTERNIFTDRNMIDKDKNKKDIQNISNIYNNENAVISEEVYSDTKAFCIKVSKVLSIVLSCIVGGILFPFLLGFSYRTVHPLFYGIAVNGNTFEVYTNKLYTGGRYYLGLNNYFLTFPRSNLYVQRILISSNSYNDTNFNDISADANSINFMPNIYNIYFDNPLKIRTSDGVFLEVDFAVNFKIGISSNSTALIAQLLDIYSNFEYDYHKFVSLSLENVANNIGSQYSTEDFFTNRLIIQQNIADQLMQELEPRYIAIT